MAKTYKGKYTVKNPEKYRGDHNNVVYRSLWERNVFRWMDSNPDVLSWNSEEVIVPYLSKTDNRWHRYYLDICFTHKTRTVFLIEIKPDSQTKKPKIPKRKTKKFLNEVLTYTKNISKWEYAQKYAQERGWVFQIWTEETLKNLGIPVVAPKPTLNK